MTPSFHGQARWRLSVTALVVAALAVGLAPNSAVGQGTAPAPSDWPWGPRDSGSAGMGRLDLYNLGILGAKVRDPAWLARMLKKPRWLRTLLGRYIRWRSSRNKRGGQTYADLSPDATDDFLRTHGYATFIHGHTHQAATHDHIVDGIHVERWVLGDWHEDRGDYLCWDGERLQRLSITAAAV